MRPEVLAEIKKSVAEADRKLTELKADILTAERAGIDVKDRKTELVDLIRKISLLKQSYT
jgi:hypothetical protein